MTKQNWKKIKEELMDWADEYFRDHPKLCGNILHYAKKAKSYKQLVKYAKKYKFEGELQRLEED